jgi:hypothetical protein
MAMYDIRSEVSNDLPQVTSHDGIGNRGMKRAVGICIEELEPGRDTRDLVDDNVSPRGLRPLRAESCYMDSVPTGCKFIGQALNMEFQTPLQRRVELGYHQHTKWHLYCPWVYS